MSIELENSPDDTVSDLSFSPDSLFIAAASWDGTCRVWRLNETLSAAQFVTHFKEVREAVLRVCWDPSSQYVYYGTSGGSVKKGDINSRQSTELCAVPGPISGLKYLESANSLIIGTTFGVLYSFSLSDGSSPIILYENQKVPESITNIDVGASFIYMITMESVPDAQVPVTHFWKGDTTKGEVKFQEVTRDERMKNVPITALSVSPQDKGWIIGYITGNLEFLFTDTDNESKVDNGHRTSTGTTKTMYSVNAVSYSPERPFAISVGGDSNLISVNLQNKRTKPSKTAGIPGTAVSLSSRQGAVAFATGNDWQEGALSYYLMRESHTPKIIIKKLTQADYA